MSDDARTFTVDIAILNRTTGEFICAEVKVVLVGTKAVTEIRTSRRFTEEEMEMLEAAMDEVVRQETGAPVVREGSATCSSQAELNARMRRHLGGGQG